MQGANNSSAGGNRATVTYTEQASCDGIPYALTLIEQESRFQGRWYCQVCGVSGEAKRESLTREGAVGRAKHSLFGHHWYAHLAGQRTLLNERRCNLN
jgi:hypothetical protein